MSESAAAAAPLILTEPNLLPAEGRKRFDQYFTPQLLATKAVEWLHRDGYIWPGCSVLEPSAGRGAWIEAVQPLKPIFVTAIDIDPERVADLNARFPEYYADQGDFSVPGAVPEAPPGFDTVIGNPPYSDAEEHTKRALAMRGRFGVVAFLLRLAFLESEKRIEFWRKHPASKIYVLSERPSFAGGGTDNAAYGIFVWATWHTGPTVIEVASWKDARVLTPVSTHSPA